jgi:hypothetical protein
MRALKNQARAGSTRTVGPGQEFPKLCQILESPQLRKLPPTLLVLAARAQARDIALSG